MCGEGEGRSGREEDIDVGGRKRERRRNNSLEAELVNSDFI